MNFNLPSNRVTQAQFDAVMTEYQVYLKGAVGFEGFEGRDLTGVTFDPAYSYYGVSFERCNLRGVTFTRCKLDLCSFVGAALEDATFDACRLVHTNMTRANLYQVTFRNCDTSTILAYGAFKPPVDSLH